MRLAVGGVLLLLSGCSQAADAPLSEANNMIDCALSGAAAFAHDCRVERAGTVALPMLIVRHPDGGFRRFEVLSGGDGLEAADGADVAKITRMKDAIEVAVGLDRYRFPADMMSHGRP